MGKDGRKCGECKYADPMVVAANATFTNDPTFHHFHFMFQCRRFPPQYMPMVGTMHPLVGEFNWCWEWKDKEEGR